MPFKDGQFDFIYCFTVLEHVKNVENSISEMVRCTKSKGKIFVETPDYRQLYEGHYKLPLPMFLPIWVNKLFLKILGRPTEFISTINKINSKKNNEWKILDIKNNNEKWISENDNNSNLEFYLDKI